MSDEAWQRGRWKVKNGDRLVFGDPDVIAWLRKAEIEQLKKEAAEACMFCDEGVRVERCQECDGTGEIETDCECQKNIEV